MLTKTFVGMVHVVMTGPVDKVANPHVSGRGVILTMLEQSGGASVVEMAETSGWKPASVHALLSVLRAAGFDVMSEAPEGRGRVHRVMY